MEMYKLDKMLEQPEAQTTDDVKMFGIASSEALVNQQAKRDDLNWLAGHFEGEGTMCLSQRQLGNGIQPTIAYTNTDSDLAEEFARITKQWVCGCYISPYPARYMNNGGMAKPFYRIAICGYKRCISFLNELIPYLRGESQQQRAILMRDFLTSRLGRDFQRYSDTEIALAEAFWKVNSSRRGLRDQMPNILEKVSKMKIESAPTAKA